MTRPSNDSHAKGRVKDPPYFGPCPSFGKSVSIRVHPWFTVSWTPSSLHQRFVEIEQHVGHGCPRRELRRWNRNRRRVLDAGNQRRRLLRHIRGFTAASSILNSPPRRATVIRCSFRSSRRGWSSTSTFTVRQGCAWCRVRRQQREALKRNFPLPRWERGRGEGGSVRNGENPPLPSPLPQGERGLNRT